MSFYFTTPTISWSRYQNNCSVILNSVPDESENVFEHPITGEMVNYATYIEALQYIKKGNILQYRKNAMELPARRRYSYLMQGFGPSRTKQYATQTATYTNPNTRSLKRVGYTTVPATSAILYAEGINNCGNDETMKDGGFMLCNITVDPCSDEVIQTRTNDPIIATQSSSDVPSNGSSKLFWSNKVKTWNSRPKRHMLFASSTFPQGFKGFTSAVHFTPPILSDVSDGSTPDHASLSWIIEDSGCMPVLSYDVYNTGVLVATTTSQNIIIENAHADALNNYSVVSVNNSVRSPDSNIVVV